MKRTRLLKKKVNLLVDKNVKWGETMQDEILEKMAAKATLEI